MAISASSKILASDVSGKIDTAGTGLTKSGTTLSLASLHSANSTIGSSSAQTLSYSGTFTIPYVTRDTYGRVSGGGTRTITMPAKPSGGTASSTTTVPNCAACLGDWNYISNTTGKWGVGTFASGSDYGDNGRSVKWTAPSGGTWGLFTNGSNTMKTISGGTTINLALNHMFAIRIA